MKNLLILGAGTGGTLLANKLRAKLPSGWHITVLDRDNDHHYQPGYLFVPFGKLAAKRLVKPRDRFLRGLDYRVDQATRIDLESKTVTTASGRELGWDQLVIATGTRTAPEDVAGMAEALAASSGRSSSSIGAGGGVGSVGGR